MSWLRDHFYRFVFPAFAAAEKRTDEIGAPFDVKVSPHAPERLPTELRKLWTLSAEYGLKWSYDVREVNHYGGTSGFRETAKLHHSILRSTLDSTLVALREEGCDRIFLGGRDVWALAVLCEKRSIPYIFVPELSRSVAGTNESKSFLESAGIKKTDLFLDTGFAGSIPRSLTRLFDFEFKFRLMSQSAAYMGPAAGAYGSRRMRMQARQSMPNQLFPNRKRARAEALETEYLAKYWRSGTIKDGKVVQYLSDRETIQRAALLTSQLWRGIPYWKTSTKSEKSNATFFGTQNVGVNVVQSIPYSTAGTISNSATNTYLTDFTTTSSGGAGTAMTLASSSDVYNKAHYAHYAQMLKQVAHAMSKDAISKDWAPPADWPQPDELQLSEEMVDPQVKKEDSDAGSDDDLPG